MSSSGSGGSSTTTQELPDWAQPYAQQLLSTGSNLANSPVPQYSGQTVAGLNSTQTGGIQGVANSAQNQAGAANAANNYAASEVANPNGYQVSNPYTGNVSASTAADSYADPSNNPALASSIAAGNQAITQSYNATTAPTTLAQFRNAGAFGGSAQQQATSNNEYQLGNALSNNTANMENSAYNTAAGVAVNNANQANAVNEENQSVGTNANAATNSLNSSNYYAQQGAINNSLAGATNANAGAATTSGDAINAGGVAQQNSQDQLNAQYQQWYNQANAPYQQESTLSSALSGALGSGAGTSSSSSTAGAGSSLATLLGLGTAGVGAYNAYQSA